MKNKVITVLLILNLITTMGILNFFWKGQISKEKEILKEMSEVEYENEINNLNISHTEYSNHIEESKRKIANAINMYINNNATDKNSLEELSIMITNLTNIPEDTYYYEKGTEGNSSTIVRYKKVDGNYYVCDANGRVTEGASAIDVSTKNLQPYNTAIDENISAGSIGYVSGDLYLGDGSDKAAYEEGYERIISAIKSKGVTPDSNSVDDIINAINKIQTDVKHSVSVQLDHTKSAYCRIYVDGKQVYNSSNELGTSFSTWYVGSISV